MRNIKKLAEGYIAFEKLWEEIGKNEEFPNLAILNMPIALSRETKAALRSMKYEDVEKNLRNAIEEVDHGSVETIDQLVRNKLLKMSG